MTFLTTTELMPHQADAVAKLLPSKVNALFAEMGTGKSRILIELAKIRAGKWDVFFWFTPVSAKQNAFGQLLEHTNLTEQEIAVWGDKINPKRFNIIGIESMSSSARTILAYTRAVTKNSFVAVDESGYIKGHKSNRTKQITDISCVARYRAVLTGTPFTQGVVDLFSQMRFLSPKILGYRSFGSFAANHLEYRTRVNEYGRAVPTGQIVKAHDIDVLAAKIAPYTYQVLKSECLDLPEKSYETRWCSLSPEQKDLYESVKKRILFDLSYEDWSPVRIFHLFTALQTVVCGWYKDPYHEIAHVNHTRIETLMSLAEEIPSGEHVIIWAKYREAVTQISKALGEKYGQESVHIFTGESTEAARNKSLQAWRDSGGWLVATQAVGSHALTLNEAAYVIFYADGFKYAERMQAEDRCHRIGQNRKPVYITIRCRETIDERIAQAISKKGSVLVDFLEEINDVRKKGLKQRAVDLVNSL